MDNIDQMGELNIEENKSWVRDQLIRKREETDIISELSSKGVGFTQARQLIDSFKAESGIIPGKSIAEPIISTAFPMAILGGLAAAVVGGGIWGLIVWVTNFEIGFMAWGMGILCGLAVLTFSGGMKGPAAQLISVGSSLFGILIGKYMSVYFAIAKMGAEKHMELKWSIFSPKAFTEMLPVIPKTLEFIDIVFVGLAIVTAWKMTRRQVDI